jgi:hypothetical protein
MPCGGLAAMERGVMEWMDENNANGMERSKGKSEQLCSPFVPAEG